MQPTVFASSRRLAAMALAAVAVSMPALAAAQYSQHNLVSDGIVVADHTDSNLINPWGISFSPTSPFWIANQGTSTSTLYNGAGVPQSLVVSTPPPGATGTVFNGTSDFVVANGSASGPARFLFADLGGGISGWNPAVNATAAVDAIDMSLSGAVYTGLALMTGGTGSRLYAANFARGAVDMFNSSFQYIGSFTDTSVTQGFSPFNVQSIGSSLFVQYAMVGPDGRAQAGGGLGFVDEFDGDGHLIRRFASNGALNAPWGVALAPSNFGTFSNSLLVGNFGDGRINAYNRTTGAFLGTISGPGGAPIVNDGLWALAFGSGGNGSNTNSLYFTAGIGGEEHGLFGRIDAVPEPATIAALSVGVVALLRRRRR